MIEDENLNQACDASVISLGGDFGRSFDLW
jgi:hypothetical protein